MKILKLYFKPLRNEAHYRFYSALIALFTEFPAVREKVSQLFTSLNAIFEREDIVVDLLRKSDYTAQIAVADSRLDNALTGFGGIIQNNERHFSPDVVTAAISLNNLLKSYGNIVNKTYNEEVAAVINLLQDLNTPAYSSKISIISGLGEWVTEINAACNEVIALLDARTTESANRPHERMIHIRREIDLVYHDIIARIEAFILIEGEEAYIAFVEKLNALISEFSKIRAHKRTKKDESGENIEEI